MPKDFMQNVVALFPRDKAPSPESVRPRKRRDNTAGILRSCGQCAAAIGAAHAVSKIDPDNEAALTGPLEMADRYLHLLRLQPPRTLEALEAKGRLIEQIFAADSVVDMSPELRRFMVTAVRDVRSFLASTVAAS